MFEGVLATPLGSVQESRGFLGKNVLSEGSSCSQMFLTIGVLKNFAIFTEKDLY